MSDFLWYEAAHFLGLLSEERAAGWPDAFTLEKLACLQFPPADDDVANTAIKIKRNIMFQILQSAVDEGKITVENRERKECFYEDKIVDKNSVDERRNKQKFTPRGFKRNESNYVKITEKKERTVTYPVIYRQYFVEFWEKLGEPASKYITAWLKAEGQQYAEKSRETRKEGAMEEAPSNEHVAANPAPQTPDESPILPDFNLTQAGVKMTFNEKTCGIGEDKWRGFFSREGSNGLIDAKIDHTKGRPIYSSKKVALWLVQEGKCEMRQIKKALGEDSKPEVPPDKWSQLKGDR